VNASVAADPSLYFAYGSNLSASRMGERVPAARVVAAARADGRRLSLGKRGRDGSGKATLIDAPDSFVWGVVYSIDPRDWRRLDQFERGYARVGVLVSWEREQHVAATTYVAPETAPDPIAFGWYKRLIVDGAREHGLPDAYVAELERLPERDDPASVRIDSRTR
jgi:gamma-glutamylcyclotransferase